MVKTNKQKFLQQFNLPADTSLSIEDMSALSGIPTEALQIVYNRGVGAWKTSPSSVRLKDGSKDYSAPRSRKMSKEQWGSSRIYAFLMKTKKVYYGADNDVREHFGLD